MTIRDNRHIGELTVISVAFCPAAQLARSIIQFRKSFSISKYRHVIVLGYYPINTKKNNRDIRMLAEAFGIEVLDPGKNLGSAQTQWWAIQKLDLRLEDYWINLDPDSACPMAGWDLAMRDVLDSDSNLVLISCFSPLVSKFLKQTNRGLEIKDREGVKYGIATDPVPFNLSMWKVSFLGAIGGIPQAGEYWGELEGPFHWWCNEKGKYHAFLLDYVEDEDGKYMQDRSLLEFKDLNMRSTPDKKFYGTYEEYLKFRYPELIKADTYIKDETDWK